jgi:hypothetical protein
MDCRLKADNDGVKKTGSGLSAVMAGLDPAIHAMTLPLYTARWLHLRTESVCAPSVGCADTSPVTRGRSQVVQGRQ